MASGGKKNKKKGKSMNLSEFLGSSESIVTTKKMDWATEMESLEEDGGGQPYGQQITFDRSVLPKAPKAARGPDVDMTKVPTQPPFTAFIGNLPYESCEDKIETFFGKLKLSSVRLPTENGRLRGFGYVEFEDRDSLLEALTMTDSDFAGRKIRVDLAGQNQNNQNSDSRRDQGPDRTDSDWRRPGPDNASNDDRGSRYGDRDGGRYGDRDGGRFGDRDGGRFGDRDGGRYGDRDGGRFGDRDGGRYGDRDGGRFGDRDGGRYGDRDGGRYGNRDGGRYGGGGRYGDRDGGRYGGGGRYGDRDGGRYGDRDGGRYGPRDGGYSGRGSSSGYSERESSQEAPKERKKLQLAPRSKPVEESENSSASTRTASIFGNAKPVDTAAKEREIDERLHTTEAKAAPVEPPREREKKASIFGDAKPVDTAAKEKEIEERLRKQQETERVLSDKDRNLDSNEELADTLARTDDQPSGRMRRDSEENRRERHASNSSSGKGSRHGHNSGGRSRKDSELSNHSTEPSEDGHYAASPKHEDNTPVKIIPAPPPKENAWAKKKPEIMSPPASQPQVQKAGEVKVKSPGNKETSRQDSRDKPRPDRDGNYRDRRDDAPRGPVGKHDGRNKENTKPKKEKPLPKTFEEMPKFNKGETKDWSDRNKFALFSSKEDDDDKDEDDEREDAPASVEAENGS